MNEKIYQFEQSFQPSILTQINDPLINQFGVELWLKRDDLLHPVISGNKWRKLKYILENAMSLNCHTMISMGGSYSNHLHALAYIGKLLKIQTIGLIRGDHTQLFSPTLEDAKAWGMELKFVSRSDYRLLRQHQNWQDLPDLPTDAYWLPEGGAQTLALQGVAEIAREITLSYDWLCTPCGTGATLAGLVKAVPEHSRILGFAALKNGCFLNKDIEGLLLEPCHNWQLNLDYHFGGFAQTAPELLGFIKQFQSQTGIPLEPVYTGKMMFGLYDLIKKRTFQPGQRIIAIHTGGLQGNRGFLGCTHIYD